MKNEIYKNVYFLFTLYYLLNEKKSFNIYKKY